MDSNSDDIEVKNLINELRDLVSNEPNNLFLGNDDRIYYRHLRLANFDVQLAFEAIKYRYKLKFRNPEWFMSLPLSKYDLFLKMKIKMMLPKRDSRGLGIYLIKAERFDVNNMPAPALMAIDDLWFETYFDEPETLNHGVICIVDLKDAPWNIIKYCTPHNLTVGVEKTESVPLKHLEFHVIGGGFLLNALISLIFPWLKRETKEKIHLHNSLSSLHKFINKEALPIEYGGTQIIKSESMYPPFHASQQMLTEIATYGYKI